jgi:hypothetical protein
MKSIETQGTFEEAIAASNAEAQQIARGLRELIVDVYAEVVEVPWPKQKVTGYGVGPKKMSEHFCYIGAHSKHVNLGFNFGADLPDPDQMLEGTGKKFRHVKVLDMQALEQSALRSLIESAVEERKSVLGPGS